MPLVVKDRVQETSTTTSTGTFTLDGAVSGFQTFSSAIGNTNTTYYTIQGGAEWEVGIGTVGAGTLSRDTVLESSSGGAKVNFSAGTKYVFCTYPAEKSVDTDTAQTLTNKTISGASNTLSNIGNSSLTNSSITINGSAISLGGSTSVGTVTSITAGTGLTGGTITGSGTIAIDSTVVTLSGIQTLTNKTLDGGTVVTANSSVDALRITQTGTGNAIRVEDSANPDATPFVVDQDGRVISGGTSPYTAGTITPKFQAPTNSVFDGGFGGSSWSSDTNAQITWFAKSKSGTIGTHSAVTSGDTLMDIRAFGSDGTDFGYASRIASLVDGTVATNSVPSRIIFSTTTTGGTSPVERMRIDSNGQVGIGTTPPAGRTFIVGKALTGSTTAIQNQVVTTIQSDVTADARGIQQHYQQQQHHLH